MSRRPRGHKPPHLVDGGYYDNYGVFTLIQWLSNALENMENSKTYRRPSQILILRIHPFPQETSESGGSHGWAYQLIAPPAGFFAVRDTAQQWESEDALLRFRRYWKRRANIEIADVPIGYPLDAGPGCGDPPVSWKLTVQQQSCIGTAWRDSKKLQPSIQQVEDLVKAAGNVDAPVWSVPQ